MKNLFYSIILIAIPGFINGQTNAETTSWINDQISQHRYEASTYPLGSFSFSNQIFEKTYLFQRHCIYKNEGAGDVVRIGETLVHYKDITSIELREAEKCYVLKLYCKNGSVKESTIVDYKIASTSMVKYAEILIDKTNPTLFERVPKGLMHLIKLNGGNATLKKAPF